MFWRHKKRQSRVEISFKHGSQTIPKEIIEILPGQEFEQGIGADSLWEGNTLVKEYNWIAGFTIVYEYFYV